jgi:CheY-like chemotaxis protein
LLSGRRKLLLADDSPAIQKVISLTFEDEGMEVVAVSNGDEALRVLEEQRPDILLADVWMPGANGYELCERVRADERLRHMPVVLLVGAFEPFNEAEARRVGADTALTKPFQSIRDLVSKVGSLLGGGGPKHEEPPAEQPRPEEAAVEASATRAEASARHAGSATPVGESSDERGGAFHSDLEPPFADLGDDDELIEAQPAESFGGAARDARSPERWQTAASPDEHSAAETFQPARAEAEEHAAAREEFEVLEHTEEFETPGHDAYAGSHVAAREAVGTNGHAVAAHGSFAARAAGAAAADDALLDLGQFEPPAMGDTAEADDFVLDLEEDLPSSPQSAGRDTDVLDAYAFDEQPVAASRPEAAGASAQPDVQSVFAQADAPSAFAEASHGTSEVVTQDEPQFFASPSVAHEVGSAPRGFVEPSVVPAEESVPATVGGEYTDGSVEGDVPKAPAGFAAQPVEEATTAAAHEVSAAPETAAPSEPSTAGYSVGEARVGLEEALRADRLSREAVDAIARRVVELMSDKVVREIAWEVVPELAELLIKQRLDEEKQK